MADTEGIEFNDYVLTIANDPEKYHPVATNHYSVCFDFSDMISAGFGNYAELQSDGTPTPYTQDVAQLILKIANDSIAEPTFSQQTLSYQKGNLTVNFPGRIDAFTGTAKFHVFVTSSAYELLYSWKMASGNHLTGEVGDPEDYWATVTIYITTGNKGTLVGSWTYQKVWLSQLSGVTFSGSANETKTCEITMQYMNPKYEGYNTSNPSAAST